MNAQVHADTLAALVKNGFDLGLEDGDYVALNYAIAALAAPPALASPTGVDEAKPVAWIQPDSLERWDTEIVTRLVRRARPDEGYTVALYTTPQPASADVDDRCVRHACKRQAMERDAEIARLRKLLAEARDVAGIDAFTIPVKGDSHAG